MKNAAFRKESGFFARSPRWHFPSGAVGEALPIFAVHAAGRLPEVPASISLRGRLAKFSQHSLLHAAKAASLALLLPALKLAAEVPGQAADSGIREKT